MIQKIGKIILLKLSSVLFHNRKSKVIFYHDIFDSVCYTNMGTPLSLFKKHIDIIQNNGFEIVTHISQPKNQIQICFDDGFHGIYDIRHFFIQKNIFPTVFLAVSLIGQSGYLNKKEIHELQNAGFIFQCHTWTHQDLTKFSQNDLQKELKESKNELTCILGKPITEICFPIGYFSPLIIQECFKYGYKKMYTSIPGNYFDYIDQNLITRNLVQFSSPRELKYILTGGYRLICSRYKKMHFKNKQ